MHVVGLQRYAKPHYQSLLAMGIPSVPMASERGDQLLPLSAFRSAATLTTLVILYMQTVCATLSLSSSSKTPKSLDKGRRAENLCTSVRDLLATTPAFPLTPHRPFLEVGVLDVSSAANNEHNALLVLCPGPARLHVPGPRRLGVEEEVVVRVLQSLGGGC